MMRVINKTTINDFSVWLLPTLEDNYTFILKQETNRNGTPYPVVVVDPGESFILMNFLRTHQMEVSEVWITHHHQDHIGGVKDLLQEFPQAHVRGHEKEGDSWIWGTQRVVILELPGHTLDHRAFWLKSENGRPTGSPTSVLFSGDVLFGMGCGRIFEGTYQQALNSIQKIANLPGTVKVFCTHEYTELNLNFTMEQPESQFLPYKAALYQRALRVKERVEKGQSTVPLDLQEEKETNLFLKALESPDPLAAFSSLRDRRNQF